MTLNRLPLLFCSCILFSATKLIAQPVPLLTPNRLRSKMKKIILTINISLLSISSFAQKEYKYVPFPTSDAIWSEVYYFHDDGYFHDDSEDRSPAYERFAVNGEDTIINGISYKKIYMFLNTEFDKNTASYIGALREDEQKRIWLKMDKSIHLYKPRLFSNAEEILLYDFSVKEGDTIKSEYFNIAGGDVVVEKIDTIKIGNTYRKKIKIKTDQWINLEWIEGIGSLYGLFFASHLKTPTGDIPKNVLIGFKHQNEILYFNDAYPSFYPTTAQGQMKVFIGNDTSFCSTNVKDGIELASQLKITNAVPPLTYKWGGAPIYPTSVILYPASRCLDDTTIANPKFKESSGPSWIEYWLEVTDSNGNIARDTILVRFSEFVYFLAEDRVSLTVGDSVLLRGGGIGGGIPPYTSYQWSPEKDLRTPNQQETWCVTSEESTIIYSVSVTDSIGCVSMSAGGVTRVKAHPTGVEKITHSTKVYRKGDQIYFENNNTGAQITIYNINGSKLYETNTRNAYFDLAGLALNKGVYVCSVLIDNELFNYKIIK